MKGGKKMFKEFKEAALPFSIFFFDNKRSGIKLD